MNIEKIKELISIIKDSSTNESTKKRAVADLKRLFGLHMHDAKTKGKRINYGYSDSQDGSRSNP